MLVWLQTEPDATGKALMASLPSEHPDRFTEAQLRTMQRRVKEWHGISASQIGRRFRAAAVAAGLGDGYSGHSGRVGMAQALAADGAGLPELMEAGRWESPTVNNQGHEAIPGAQDPKTTPACPKALNRLLGQGISRNSPVNARLRDCHITDISPLHQAVT